MLINRFRNSQNARLREEASYINTSFLEVRLSTIINIMLIVDNTMISPKTQPQKTWKYLNLYLAERRQCSYTEDSCDDAGVENAENQP